MFDLGTNYKCSWTCTHTKLRSLEGWKNSKGLLTNTRQNPKDKVEYCNKRDFPKVLDRPAYCPLTETENKTHTLSLSNPSYGNHNLLLSLKTI